MELRLKGRQEIVLRAHLKEHRVGEVLTGYDEFQTEGVAELKAREPKLVLVGNCWRCK